MWGMSAGRTDTNHKLVGEVRLWQGEAMRSMAKRGKRNGFR